MKFRVKNTLLIGFAFMSIMVLWQAYNWLVPLYLDDYLKNVFNGNEFLIGLVMGLDNIFAVFMIPLVSRLSDKQKKHTGSRMPLIILGILLAGMAFIFLPIAKSNIWLMILTLFVILVSMNIYRAPAVSLMPDITPKPLRSKANAVINIMGGIGTGIGYLLLLGCGLLNFDSGFSVWGVVFVMFGCLAMLMYKVDEKKFESEMKSDLAEAEKHGLLVEDNDELGTLGGKLGRADGKNLLFVLVSVFFYYMATNSVETFMSLYSNQVLKDTNAGLMLIGVLAVGSFCFLYPAAIYADKHGYRNAMLFGTCIMAISNIFISFFVQFSWMLAIAFFTTGAGMAFMIANMYPLVVGFCKKGDFAKYTGYYYTATMIAQALTPMFAGLLFSKWVFGSMRVLMPYSAIFMTLSAGMLFFVKRET